MVCPVTVGVLTRGVVSTEWAFSFRKLRLPEGAEFVKIPGLPFDHARNEISKKSLTNGSDWTFFIDDDVIVPQDAFLQMTAWNKPIVSGLYYKRQGKIVPTAYREAASGPAPIPSANAPGLVDFVGGGCLLIHRQVLEKVKFPWFKWTQNDESLKPQDRLGEDFNFCRKARQAGFEILLDTTVKCRHVGEGWSDENGKFVPVPPPLL